MRVEHYSLSFIGMANFSAAGQLHYFLSNENTTVIEGDINGDGIADFQIQVNGVTALDVTDFILHQLPR